MHPPSPGARTSHSVPHLERVQLALGDGVARHAGMQQLATELAGVAALINQAAQETEDRDRGSRGKGGKMRRRACEQQPKSSSSLRSTEPTGIRSSISSASPAHCETRLTGQLPAARRNRPHAAPQRSVPRHAAAPGSGEQRFCRSGYGRQIRRGRDRTRVCDNIMVLEGDCCRPARLPALRLV